MEEDYYDEDYYSEEEEDAMDTGCSYPHSIDEHCPECCEFEGDFQGGVEECEFCPYADECYEAKEHAFEEDFEEAEE